MPTIHRERGFEVAIHTHDHTPPHVHVFRAEAEVLINLGTKEERPAVREVFEMKARDVRRALEIVEQNQDAFTTAWEAIHGRKMAADE